MQGTSYRNQKERGEDEGKKLRGTKEKASHRVPRPRKCGVKSPAEHRRLSQVFTVLSGMPLNE